MNDMRKLFFDRPVVAIDQLRQSGLIMQTATYATLGGGLGSFIWADHLRICGVPANEIIAVGVTPQPHDRYRRLCLNSQIPEWERLRSDSGSTPDNVWGWPGYAVREIGQELGRGRLDRAGRLAWQICSETAIAEAYTPRASAVYDAIERETQRIGWSEMWRYGRIRAIRKTDDGRYAVLCEHDSQPSYLIIVPYLHLALGYPGVRFLPDLQAYRQRSGDGTPNGDGPRVGAQRRVVNAYEAHEDVYRQLAADGGVVLLRGRGIVASRILQRLHEVQIANPDVAIRVVHLMRSPRPEETRYQRASRTTEHHWQLQAYNFPKACFTGDLRRRFAQMSPEDRASVIATWAGTTTADRADWRRIVDEGMRAGWYQIRFGAVEAVVPAPTNQVCTTVRVRSELDERAQIVADFIIDCTGLNSDITANPVLRDLLSVYKLPCNPMGNLAVTPDFEVDALRNGRGQVFASGVLTLGGPFGPVDSFLGLQYAAHRSADILTRVNAPHMRRLTPLRSVGQWLRWARKAAP